MTENDKFATIEAEKPQLEATEIYEWVANIFKDGTVLDHDALKARTIFDQVLELADAHELVEPFMPGAEQKEAFDGSIQHRMQEAIDELNAGLAYYKNAQLVIINDEGKDEVVDLAEIEFDEEYRPIAIDPKQESHTLGRVRSLLVPEEVDEDE